MQKKDMTGGIILVVIGLIALLGQFIPFSDKFGLLILPGLGAMFIVWGILTRNAGLMIPGGILSGIGWGVYAIAGPFTLWQGGNEGGVFLLSLGLGFASITLLTAVFTKETHWWALIPGAIIGLVGSAIFFGGAFLEILELLGKLWPLALIIVGIGILFNARRDKNDIEKVLTEK